MDSFLGNSEVCTGRIDSTAALTPSCQSLRHGQDALVWHTHTVLVINYFSEEDTRFRHKNQLQRQCQEVGKRGGAAARVVQGKVN